MRVGFVITATGSNWLGGLNYFRNLITAVKDHPELEIEPVIFIGAKDDENLFKDFPKVEIIKNSIIDRLTLPWVFRKVFQKLFQRDFFLEKLLKYNNIDVLSHSGSLGSTLVKNNLPTIGWIPDFQHRHLPSFFETQDLEKRDAQFQDIATNCTRVILSSHEAQKDFSQFYPKFAEKAEVLQFVISSSASKNRTTFETVKTKYHIEEPYFFLPNQFWEHKNHTVVIEALKLASEKGCQLNVVCTGSTEDYRRPEYFRSLKALIEKYKIEQFIKILGIVPYDDLLILFQNAKAIINPSLFEGWSTTVEEAKALGKFIILSDIKVHREQNPKDAVYFNAKDSVDLVEKMIHANAQDEIKTTLTNDLPNRVQIFAQKYKEILCKVNK
jgi:glycosyltransferase involved in cell wall biosynthesis